MNRPYGAADVTANLKKCVYAAYLLSDLSLSSAIPKATVPKILLSLAEKGELTQKAYGIYILPCNVYDPQLSPSKDNVVRRESSKRRKYFFRTARTSSSRVHDNR